MSAKRRERVIFSSTPGTAPENTALHDSDTVSYTHLDVYKRQAPQGEVL